MSIVPLICGVAFATYGDYYFTLRGFSLTLLSVLLAAVKAIAGNRLMTGSLKLSALEILMRMSPLAAFQCLVYAWVSGELDQFRASVAIGEVFTSGFRLALACNAATAFALNVVSFHTNKVAGALTVSVCANVKQALTITLGIVLFHVQMSWLNGLGTVVTVFGAAWYSKVELYSNRKAQRT